MAVYNDVSLDFDLDGQGRVRVLEDGDAINQALYNFINMSAGDFIYFPSATGFTQGLVYKNINDETLTLIRFQLTNLLRKHFYPQISVVSLDVSQKNDATVSLSLTYMIQETQEVRELELQKEHYLEKPKKFTMQEVSYTGENLENFILIQMDNPEQDGCRLILNTGTNLWEWGSFIFKDFNVSSSNFSEVLKMING